MLRIYSSGRITIEADGKLFGPGQFPGQQARAAFALLVGEGSCRKLIADELGVGPSPETQAVHTQVVRSL